MKLLLFGWFWWGPLVIWMICITPRYLTASLHWVSVSFTVIVKLGGWRICRICMVCIFYGYICIFQDVQYSWKSVASCLLSHAHLLPNYRNILRIDAQNTSGFRCLSIFAKTPFGIIVWHTIFYFWKISYQFFWTRSFLSISFLCIII